MEAEAQAGRGNGSCPLGRSRRERAFSLIELMITMVLMLIMAVMFTRKASGSRQKRDITVCAKNLQAIHTALMVYSTDSVGGKFPLVTGAKTAEEPLSLLVPRSTTGTEVFICPGSGDEGLPQAEPFADKTISYGYYMGWQKETILPTTPILSDRQIDALSKTNGQPLFSSTGKGAGANHHKYGGNVLYFSGEVQRSKTNSTLDLSFPANIVFLNPKP